MVLILCRNSFQNRTLYEKEFNNRNKNDKLNKSVIFLFINF